MPTRRQLLFVAAATLGLTPVVAWFGSPARANRGAGLTGADGGAPTFPVHKTDDVWKRELNSEQYYVLRSQGTERAHSSPLDHETRRGTFHCAGCGQALFESSAKFDSRTGWPSFSSPIDGAVGTSVDRSYFMVRTEVHCSRCGGHIGHVFDDGPKPTGLRYCMNGVALRFEAAA